MSFKFLILIFFVVVFSSSVLAVPLNLDFEKDSYFSGETVQGRMFSDDSLEDNVVSTDFYLSFNDTDFDIYPILVNLEGYTYFYFNIPVSLEQGDYDLIIKDVIFVDNGILVEEDQLFNLNVNVYNESILTVDPGIIVVNVEENNWFSIEVSNPSGHDASVSISSPDGFIFTSDESFSLSSLDSKDVQFYVSTSFADKIESSVSINYGNLSYSIPVFIDGLVIFNETELNETNTSESEGNLEFEQRGFDLEIEEGESSSGFVKIINNFDMVILNVNIILSENLEGIVDVEFEEIESIGIGEVVKNHIYINEAKDSEDGEYEGTLDLEYDGVVYDSIPIFVNILEEIVIDDNSTIKEVNETDDVDLDEEGGNTGLFVGILIFVVILGLLIFIKYKKSKKKDKFPY